MIRSSRQVILGLAFASASVWAQLGPTVPPIPLVRHGQSNGAGAGLTAAAVTDQALITKGPIPDSRLGVWRGRSITFQVIGGLAVVEGDIILGTPEQIGASASSTGLNSSSTGVIGDQARWSNATVPYLIDPALPQQTRITDAIAAWHAKTGIRFVPRTTETDYVQFVQPNSAGTCNSSVGRIGGRQTINLGDGCSTGNAIHEMGHAIGLWHEQSRLDRDRYVSVLTANISKGFVSQYNQALNSGEDIGNYDYSSIMHYAPGGFTSNSLPTLESKPAGISMGQRNQLSSHDIDSVQRMYGFPVRTTTIDSNPSGLTVTVDGTAYTTPAAFNWVFGTTHMISATGPQLSSDGYTRYQFGRWGNDGPQTQTITANASQTVYTAHYITQFKLITYNDTLGTVAVSPSSADGFYAQRSLITATATATATANGNFVHWYNYCRNTLTNPCTFSLDYGVGDFGLWAGFSNQRPVIFTSNTPFTLGRFDGAYYWLPTAFAWTAGSSHAIEAPLAQSSFSGVNNLFQSWSDGGAAIHNVIASGATVQMNNTTQYQLLRNWIFNGNNVSATPASSNDFYNAGTPLQVSAVAGAGFQFLFWLGDLSGATATQSLTMNDVMEANATFTPSGCTARLSSTSLSVAASGGAFRIPTGSGGNCFYYSFSFVSWVSPATTAALGDSSVSLTVAPNATGAARTGIIMLGSQAFTVTQAAAGSCAYTFTPSSATVNAAGGSAAITVQTTAGCAWNAAANESWITLSGATSGSGSGSFTFTAAANGANDRTGTITIAGQPYVITQFGTTTQPGCTFGVTPTTALFSPNGAPATVQVTASASNCPWTATSAVPWITITSGAAGTGNGAVNYTVAGNLTLTPRSATFTAAGVTVTVNQAANPALSSQIGIFRASGTGGVMWVRDRSGDGLFTGAPDTALGLNVLGTTGDQPLIGDWNGSGTKKLGIYRPFGSAASGAGLFVLDYDGNESWNGAIDKALWFAPKANDVAVVGKWAGGAQDRAGLFRNGVFYLDINGDGSFSRTIVLGQAGDIPVVGDWNGDGRTKVGIFRDGLWVLDYNGNGQWDGLGIDRAFSLGQAGDQAVVGDWNGDGRAKAGVFRRSNSFWVLDYNGNGQWDGIGIDRALYNGFDTSTSIAVVGDWTGDGKTKAGTYKDGVWFLDPVGDGSFNRLAFLGTAGDTPIAGKW